MEIEKSLLMKSGYISGSTVNICFKGFQKQCDFSPTSSGHIEFQVFLSCEVAPLNGVIEAVFG